MIQKPLEVTYERIEKHGFNTQWQLKETRIMENIANIGIMAGHLITEGTLVVVDSASLNSEIVRLGYEFEEKYSDDELDGDYIGIIDKFSKEKLLEYYGMNID